MCELNGKACVAKNRFLYTHFPLFSLARSHIFLFRKLNSGLILLYMQYVWIYDVGAF